MGNNMKHGAPGDDHVVRIGGDDNAAMDSYTAMSMDTLLAMQIEKEKEMIIEAGRRLWARGMVAANDGNISCRLGEAGILITRSGVSKGYMSNRDILRLDAEGNQLPDSLGAPSLETKMHLAIYQAYPEVRAIIHAHPPYATAFAVAHKDINSYELEELRLQLGQVAFIPYAPAGSQELADLAAPAMKGARAGLLDRHGAIAVGMSIREVLYRMEALEQSAKIILNSQLLR